MKPVQLGALGTGHLPPEQCSHKENPDVSARSDTAANVYYGLETPYCLHNLGREKFLMRVWLGTTFQCSSPHLKKKKISLGLGGTCPWILIRLMTQALPNHTLTHTKPSVRRKMYAFETFYSSQTVSDVSWTFSQVLKVFISIQSLTESKNLGLFQKKFN